LEREEHYTKKELERTEAERGRCEDTLDAEGSEIRTFRGINVWVKVTQEQSDHINEIQNDSEDDFTWPDKIGIGSSQNSETESDRESDKESDINNEHENKGDKDTIASHPVSSDYPAREDSSNPLPSDAKTTITESKPKAVRSWFDIVMNGTGPSPENSSKNPSENPAENPSENPPENPSSANIYTRNAPSTDPSQKTEENPGSSVSTDNKNTDDKKLTPGDFLDGLPQEMPS
jgi:hypothetical protein